MINKPLSPAHLFKEKLRYQFDTSIRVHVELLEMTRDVTVRHPRVQAAKLYIPAMVLILIIIMQPHHLINYTTTLSESRIVTTTLRFVNRTDIFSNDASPLEEAVYGGSETHDVPRHLIAPSPFEGSNSELLASTWGISSQASDFSDVRHCNLTALNQTAFNGFRKAILNHPSFYQFMIANSDEIKNQTNLVEFELTLQALERFAKAAGVCNFDYYRPSIPDLPSLQVVKERVQNIPWGFSNSTAQARLVFLISFFKDFEHLEKLVKSVFLPQHLIIVHLERGIDTLLEGHVRQLERNLTNVVVMKYGSIVYPSDSLSHVFLQIMRFVHQEIRFQYDYMITLGSSSYPLWSAVDMAEYLWIERRRVRLGLFDYRMGARLCMWKARSFSASYTNGRGIKGRILNIDDLAGFTSQSNVTVSSPEAARLNAFSRMGQVCTLKTNSGNTAAYDYRAVQQLLNSNEVMELFAHFKSAGGCCVEESSWGAALTVIGRKDELSQVGSMWQVWPCGRSSMNNAEIQEDTACLGFFTDAGTKKGNQPINKTVLENAFREAKERGQLFARKFSSGRPYWVDWIRSNLHSEGSKP